MRATLARKLSNPEVLWLIDLILASGEGVLHEAYDVVYFPGDNLFASLRPCGLPIDNLTSQFWPNVYLNAFDHFVKRELRCKAYLRYVDDLLFFADDNELPSTRQTEYLPAYEFVLIYTGLGDLDEAFR